MRNDKARKWPLVDFFFFCQTMFSKNLLSCLMFVAVFKYLCLHDLGPESDRQSGEGIKYWEMDKWLGCARSELVLTTCCLNYTWKWVEKTAIIVLHQRVGLVIVYAHCSVLHSSFTQFSSKSVLLQFIKTHATSSYCRLIHKAVNIIWLAQRPPAFLEGVPQGQQGKRK